MCVRKLMLVVSVLVAAAPAAAGSDTLESYFGVWISHSAAAGAEVNDSLPIGRNIDVALWKSDTGFVITWKQFEHEAGTRSKLRFVPAREPATFEVETADPPSQAGERIWAKLQVDRLTVYKSNVSNRQLISYELSVSNGSMRFTYTLARGGQLLETLTHNLYRAKVVM